MGYVLLASTIATLLYAVFSIIALRCCITVCIPSAGSDGTHPELAMKGVLDTDAQAGSIAAANPTALTAVAQPASPSRSEPIHSATTYQAYDDNPFASPPVRSTPNPFDGPARRETNPFA